MVDNSLNQYDSAEAGRVSQPTQALALNAGIQESLNESRSPDSRIFGAEGTFYKKKGYG
jgi:hypothetical protein